MPRQPSTLFELHTQQQPFTLVHECEAWHVTFPGHRCELDVHGSRIEAQAIARCYYSLFLAGGAPFAHADMSECEQLDLAEREAAIEIEVQQRRMDALLYGANGDGALASVRVEEPPARYLPGGTSPKRVLVTIEQEHPWSSTTSNSNTHGEDAGDLPTSATSAPIPMTPAKSSRVYATRQRHAPRPRGGTIGASSIHFPAYRWPSFEQ